MNSYLKRNEVKENRWHTWLIVLLVVLALIYYSPGLLRFFSSLITPLQGPTLCLGESGNRAFKMVPQQMAHRCNNALKKQVLRDPEHRRRGI